MKNKTKLKDEQGSIELIVLGLLAALIVALAVPALFGIGKTTNKALEYTNTKMNEATANIE